MSLRRKQPLKNADGFASAAELYTNNATLSQTDALEQAGLTPNQYNAARMKELVDPDVIKQRTGRVKLNVEQFIASADVYMATDDCTMKTALESQGITYNQHNMKRMKEHIPQDILDSRKANRVAVDESIYEATIEWMNDETQTMSIAESFRRNDVKDNQYNRRKFADCRLIELAKIVDSKDSN